MENELRGESIASNETQSQSSKHGSDTRCKETVTDSYSV
jgi:hypothetical protein